MVLSICIVSWNTVDLLSQCLSSIFAYTENLEFEVIIVDNGSTDGTLNMIKNDFPQCKLIESAENLGFTKANNLAVQHARGKYILYLNPDTELVSNSPEKMVHFLENNPNYGAIGPKLTLADGSIQYVCARTFPTPQNQFNLLTMLDRLFSRSKYFSTVEMRYWDHNESRNIDCLLGACILTRKQIIDEIGGFDENIFMYAEDVDLCYRLHQAGWDLYYDADIMIKHYAGSSSKKEDYRFFSTIVQRESNAYFLHKHFGKSTMRRYIAAVFFGSFIRILIITLILPFRLFSESIAEKISIYTWRKYSKLLFWSLKYAIYGYHQNGQLYHQSS